MAGFYPDVPGPRVLYDRDGSVGLLFMADSGFSNAPTHVIPNFQMQNLNNEAANPSQQQVGNWAFEGDPNWVQFGCGGLAIVLSYAHDIVGYEIAYSAPTFYTGSLQWSPNSTNGRDGTWFTGPNTSGEGFGGQDKIRTSIASWVQAGVKAIRWSWCSGGGRQYTYYFHLYGSVVAGQALERPRIWRPDIDQEVGGAYFDWGDPMQGSTAERAFRVKNISPTRTLLNITLGLEALTEVSPPMVSQQRLSSNGGVTWSAFATIDQLDPGEISPEFLLRRDILGTAQLGPAQQRLIPTVGSMV